MKNTKIKLGSIILLVFIIAGACSGYHIYSNRIIFPDKESEQIIKNIINDNKIIIKDANNSINQFNDAIHVFGGVENITLNGNVLEMQPEQYNKSSYSQEYNLKDKFNINNDEEYYKYICTN